MIKKENIISDIKLSLNPVIKHVEYSQFPGIYAFFLNEKSTLKEFGQPNSVLYVGIAKESLAKRDLGDHFNSDNTGRSTLRRSIGSILKADLNLKAFSRNGTDSKKEISHYVFNSEGDVYLTEWMKNSLVVGYWEDKKILSYDQLRDLEVRIIKDLKPTLDLDNRTRRYNPLSNKLDELRRICRIEALENTRNGLTRKTYLG